MKIVNEMPKEDGKVVRLSVWQQYDGSQEIQSETLKIIGGVAHFYCDDYEDWLEDDENMKGALEIKYAICD
ncbi:MAG TPA: hypothetical protein PLW01_02495 [Agitococcus sp.]|nr:hypothetical protein [Agitococcus sp.]